MKSCGNCVNCNKVRDGFWVCEEYGYYYGRNELDAFQNYLYETDFYYNIPEHIHCYIDVEKVKRDYYFIDIDSTDKFEEYLFIFD